MAHRRGGAFLAFEMMPEQAETLGALAAVVRRVCPQYGIDPAKCMQEAERGSGRGKFALNFNYWGLRGSGDLGYHLHVAGYPLAGSADGWGGESVPVARFKSLDSAVHAYCRRSGKQRNDVAYSVKSAGLAAVGVDPPPTEAQQQAQSGAASSGIVPLIFAASLAFAALSGRI